MKIWIFVILIFLGVISDARAGSPGGIALFVRSLDSAVDYKYIIDGFFRNYYGSDNPKTPTCKPKGYTPYVGLAYLNTPVDGVTNELLSQSITSDKARRVVSQYLVKFKDDRISGFDGVLLYSVKDDALEYILFFSVIIRNYMLKKLN